MGPQSFLCDSNLLIQREYNVGVGRGRKAQPPNVENR